VLVALVGECSIPVVYKVARQPFSSYRVTVDMEEEPDHFPFDRLPGVGKGDRFCRHCLGLGW
jgi:hypothetical protein